jgi:endonuclease-3
MAAPSHSEEIARRLRSAYGPRKRRREDPTDVLLRTVLSQNTSDANSDRAFAILKARFPTPKDLASASLADIRRAIRVGGLYKRKARVIRNLSRELVRRGLALEGMDDQQARSHLRSLEGVGPKTAACVLLFGLGRDVMPVDTHVYRLSRRIGLLDEKVPIDRADLELEKIVPPKIRYHLHLDLIEHGRKVCRPARPRCGICLIADLCNCAKLRGTGKG